MCTCVTSKCLDSLKLYTDWSYNLNVVKNIVATPYFLDLEDSIKKCNVEPFDECKTRYFTRRALDDCGCLPLSMALEKPKVLQ